MSPRTPRFQLSTHTYFHICTKGNNGQEIFFDNADFRRYFVCIEKYRERYALRFFAYCLMDNHAHLLLRAPSLQTLSKAMHDIQVAYAMYFNRRHQRQGHLFQERFTSWVIENEGHLLEAKEYIENNPVKAGIVTQKEDYLWSSAIGDRSPITLSPIML